MDFRFDNKIILKREWNDSRDRFLSLVSSGRMASYKKEETFSRFLRGNGRIDNKPILPLYLFT